jgi:hypothetical protein
MHHWLVLIRQLNFHLLGFGHLHLWQWFFSYNCRAVFFVSDWLTLTLPATTCLPWFFAYNFGWRNIENTDVDVIISVFSWEKITLT